MRHHGPPGYRDSDIPGAARRPLIHAPLEGDTHRPNVVVETRNAYFNEAINLYNKVWKRKLLKQKLAKDSALVAADSLEVLEAFERLEDELSE